MTIMANDNIREYVNGGQLPAVVGNRITIMGFVADEAPEGSTSFDMLTVDNETVTVNFSSPIEEPAKGYVEVHGISLGGKKINADHLVVFKNPKMDKTSYNNLCKYIQRVPHLFKTSNKSNKK